MTYDEMNRAFCDLNAGCHIRVETRSGKPYDVHEDQLPAARQVGLICGTPVKRHPRDNNSVRWFFIKNVLVVGGQP